MFQSSLFHMIVKTNCLHPAIDDHRLHVEDTLYILFTAMELYSSMEISGNESFVHLSLKHHYNNVKSKDAIQAQ